MKPIFTREDLYNPDKCPCGVTSCQVYKNCDACLSGHHTKGKKTMCERKVERLEAKSLPKEQ